MSRDREIIEIVSRIKDQVNDSLSFKEAFSKSLIPSALVRYDGTWHSVNAALCDYLGYTQKEILDLDWPTLTSKNDLESDWAKVQECLEGFRESYQINKSYLHKRGENLPSHLFVTILREKELFLSQIIPTKFVECKACPILKH